MPMPHHNPSLSDKQSPAGRLLLLFCASVLVLAAGILCSLKWGAAHVTWTELVQALTYQGSGKAHLYIQTLRLPRTLTACIVGAQLALAGLLTQLATKNPLASPHVFGINAGAAFAVVLGLAAAAELAPLGTVLAAFAGAAGGALLIWTLAGNGPKQVVRLALSGIVIHFLLSSLTEGLIILNQQSTENILFWLVGSVNQAAWPEVRLLLPFLAGGLLLLLFMLPAFRLLTLDDEVAAGLGQRVTVVRTACMGLVILLAGSAVAVCGPIGFVCLIVPHIARALAGSRLPVLVPLTALLGGAMLVYADFLSRFIAFPYESPVGIVTSAIGAPFFIYLTVKKGRAAS
ncbi:transport system permease [Paenibacillus mucilaginosus 3016]|uniref:Transport system permease n=2 Tax=Paenibacillus mucilaginosus TaxID=61624 RepID=H6NM01_9BACL|nr:transport system permease [Paenibacillus mucilaginosus 3016]AFH64731.1 ABC transporter permease [Paenibacillus mucilaginosus K02]WFA20904.1 iron ABC transporter permease [Paenibacillus mucilaginosus]